MSSIESRVVEDLSGNGLVSTVANLPTRAVTGHRWDGTVHDWRLDSSHYATIHFHSDDLYDAGWQPTAEVTVPTTWRSGMFAARFTTAEHTEYVPFFVAPLRRTATADAAFLAPTATYVAYANMPDPRATLTPAADPQPRPARRALGVERRHAHHRLARCLRRRVRRRHRPPAPRRGLRTPRAVPRRRDGLPSRVLEHRDEDRARGVPAMRRAVDVPRRERLLLAYRVQRRLAGGDPVRRAEDGTRTWIAEPGEYHHAWGGELGGIWRRLGRAPNALVGVGMAAQGWCPTIGYQVRAHADDPRVAFMFGGVDATVIGDHGRMGGAAGEEIDRFDVDLGSPSHAVIIATAQSLGPAMLKTKEEFLYTAPYDAEDPDIRSDVVFFEIDGGGAVFSVGSIAWAGSLGANGYRNDLARLTTNVVRRFADPEPFMVPTDHGATAPRPMRSG